MKDIIFKIFKKIDFFYVILLILTIYSCYKFAGHTKILFNDWGREFTFPSEMLNGDVLYRDIFNLFGPGAYFINAAVYKILGSDLKTHYLLGYISSIMIISGIYFVSALFNDKFKSFIIGLFSISIGVAVVNWSNCNYHFPYTYSVVYGLIFWYISVWLLIKSKIFSEKKFITTIFSALTAGFCASTKYEFMIYGLLFLIFITCAYGKNIKKLLLLFLSFFITPGIQLGYLLLKGLSITKLIDSFFIMKNLIDTPAYKYFYTIKGAIFSPEVLKLTLTCFGYAIAAMLILSIPFILKKRNKILAYISFVPAVTAGYYIIKNIPCFRIENDGILSFMPIALSLLILLNIKRLPFEILMFALSGLSISLKIFWNAQTSAYGNYFLPILCIAFITVVKSKKIKNAAVIYFLIAGVILIMQNMRELPDFSFPVNGTRGTLYTDGGNANQINSLINYINENISQNETIVILPEGLTVNYLTQREKGYFLYALQPPYAELFGIDKYIEQYKKTPPDYFILNVVADNAFNYPYYCEDYAEALCKYIEKDYYTERKILAELSENDYNSYIIYKKRSLNK